MALTTVAPYKQHNYMGHYATSTAANSAWTGVGFSSDDGVFFYDTALDNLVVRANGGWEEIYSAKDYVETATAGAPIKLDSSGFVAAPQLGLAALLAGRSGGQTIYGGTGANDDLTLYGTSHGTTTTSYVIIKAELDMDSNRIIGVATPTAGTDSANKDYVDSVAQGLDWQTSVLDFTSTVPGSPSSGDRYLIADVGSEAISAVSIASDTFTVAADLSSAIAIGDIIRVGSSTGNNRWWTVTGVTGTGPTVITVSEDVTDATVDGTLYYGSTGTAWVTDAAGGPGKIAEYNGAFWDYSPALSTPAALSSWEGAAVWVEDEDVLYVFNAAAWVQFGSTVSHNNLSGLQGGTTSEYYHLTSAQHSGLTGGSDTSLHTHDGRYYTETELGSTASGSEGATLIGTADLANLGSAANVQLALEATDTHVGSTANPHTVTLNQAYEGHSGAALVTVDLGSVTWALGGTAYAFAITSTNDTVSFTGDSGGDIDAVMNVQSLDVDTSGNMSNDIGGNFTVDAAGSISLDTTYNNAAAVNITTNGGTSEVIAVTNTQGTAANAIDISATAGGIDVDAAGGIDLNAAGKLSFTGGSGSTWQIAATSAGAEVLDINVTNAGAGTGDLDIDADDAITIDSANSTIGITANTTLSLAGSTAVAIDGASVEVNDSTVASTNSVDMYAGTGHFTISTTDTNTGTLGTGDVRISTGDQNAGVTGGTPGDILLTAGAGATAGPNGGHVVITGGGSTSAVAGNVSLVSGTSGSGTDGNIIFTSAGNITFTDGNWDGTTDPIPFSDATNHNFSGFSTTPLSLVHAINLAYSAASSSTDLNEAYDNFGAVAATVVIDNAEGQGNLTWQLGNGRSMVVRAGAAGESVTFAETGTDDMNVTMAITALDVNATGAVTIDSSGGAISIGSDAVAQAINIGTGAAARTITMGNVTGATGVAINTGTAGLVLNSSSMVDIIRDEDDMASDDVNALATQQSIKAYVDGSAFSGVTSGAGTPEGSESANPGDLYVDTTNTLVYVKASGTGNTGWALIA